MGVVGWSWDASLYAGAAPFYPLGRVPYPPELATLLRTALSLDGTGRLLDVGCGPGSLTLPLAHLFAEVIGIDADADMLAEAERQAARRDIAGIRWAHLRAEQLPAGLPPPSTVTFAQSFHWMDQPVVAAAARRMLTEGGALVHVAATTHEGWDSGEPLPHPRPPRAEIAALVREFLGVTRRAGRSALPDGTASGEDAVLRAAGFAGPERLELPARVVTRSAAEVRASVYSLSSAAPHLFGPDLTAFDARLRALLDGAAADGVFSEQLPGAVVGIWR